MTAPFGPRAGEEKQRLACHLANEEWDTSRRVVLGWGKDRKDHGCCRVLITAPFWESESQRLEYEHAVEETRDMLPSERLRTIAKKYGGGLGRME